MKRALVFFLCVAFSAMGTLRCLGQPAVVAAVKMNVAYIGVPNPIEVAACGYPESAVSVTVDNGTLTKTGVGKYDWMVTKQGDATVTVWVMKGGKKVQLGETKFRVKYIPDPSIAFPPGINMDGVPDGTSLRRVSGLIATLKGFVFDAQFTVSRYKVEIFHNGTSIYVADITGPYFTKELKEEFHSIMRIGDKVHFTNIYAIGPDGRERPLGDVFVNAN